MIKEDLDFYEKYGIRKIINATGTMTSLGGSCVSNDVIEEVSNALSKWVEIDLLQKKASQIIAEVTDAEAGFVTACAAAGITIGVAACMTGKNIGKVVQLPDTKGMKNEVILQKGHSINFGANVSQMIRLSGAKCIEFGSLNGTSGLEMRGVISENTAAAIYVVSHHTSQYGMVPFTQFLEIAHENEIPVIVDAASEYSFANFISRGADLVTCSGHKFLFGPTSGLIAGKKDLIEACHLNNSGIGRTMKVGKEGIVGLIAALEVWKNRDLEREHEETYIKAKKVCDQLEKVNGISAVPIEDPTGNPITRVQVNVNTKEAGIDAFILANELKEAKTPIITRSHHVEEGYFQLDMCFINDNDIDYICTEIKTVLNKSQDEKDNLWNKYIPRIALWDSLMSQYQHKK